MKLKDRCRYIRCDRSVQRFVQSICLGTSCCYKKNFLCCHNVLDSHGVCLFRNFIHTFKKSCICLDSAFCKVYTMSFLLKSFSGFIETNMSVSANSQKLDINSTYTADDLIIICTCFVAVFFQSVWHISSCFVNIYMIEQVCVHEITVALVVVTGKSFILIQVYRCDL